MSWQGIQGHDDVVKKFRQALQQSRLASTFLFVGPPGIGKRLFSIKLAQTLLCQKNRESEMEPCGECPGCRQVAALSHPDLEIVSKPADRSFIPVALLIGEKEHRMQQGLCHAISLKPFMGGRKIAIIDDADYLNQEGANCLLKTLEEPPPRSVMILIGTSAEKQLPTIRSRCQVVRFTPLSEPVLAGLLLEKNIAHDVDGANRLARYSAGTLDRAGELADPELWAFRRDLLARLAAADFDSVRLAQDTVAFIEAAGKDASPRRTRSRQLIGFAVEYYRQLLRAQSGATGTDDPELRSAVERAMRNWADDEEISVACLERCLDALSHLDRNANQTTLVECWFDDLATLRNGRRLAV